MSVRRPFRFGVVAAQAPTAQDWIATARQAEQLGFSSFLIPDTLGPTLAPISALTAVAVSTQTLRVGPYVLANDLRNPVLLARECATLDYLSGGRFELGLGAGRPGIEADYRKAGILHESGGVRVSRLTEALDILKRLLSGERVDLAGAHYTVVGADNYPPPVQRPHPPIMIAASGKRLLSLAAREADIVALGVAPNQPEAVFQDRVDMLREAAGERFSHLEININLSAIGDRIHPWMAKQFGVTLEGLREIGSPSVLLGDTDEMCAQLEARRERLGISYVNCGADMMDLMAPVVARLAGR
ncbi:MAG: TIGR03621 family F420-dependent LLM class oxidoreductase [Chloroflexota bacterium]